MAVIALDKELLMDKRILQSLKDDVADAEETIAELKRRRQALDAEIARREGTEPNPKTYKCSKCLFTCESKDDLSRHQTKRNHHRLNDGSYGDPW